MEAPVLVDVHVRVGRSLFSDSNTSVGVGGFWQCFYLFWQLLCEKMMIWKQDKTPNPSNKYDGFALV